MSIILSEYGSRRIFFLMSKVYTFMEMKPGMNDRKMAAAPQAWLFDFNA